MWLRFIKFFGRHWMLIAMAAAVAMSAGTAWKVQDWRYGKRIAENLNVVHEQYQLAMQDKARIEQLRTEKTQAVMEAATLRQQEQEVVTKTVTKEVIKYVQSDIAGKCDLPNQWVRIHDTAARGQVDLPDDRDSTAESDEDPSGITDIEALSTVTENYGTCQEIRNQLISLQEWVRANHGDDNESTD